MNRPAKQPDKPCTPTSAKRSRPQKRFVIGCPDARENLIDVCTSGTTAEPIPCLIAADSCLITVAHRLVVTGSCLVVICWSCLVAADSCLVAICWSCLIAVDSCLITVAHRLVVTGSCLVAICWSCLIAAGSCRILRLFAGCPVQDDRPMLIYCFPASVRNPTSAFCRFSFCCHLRWRRPLPPRPLLLPDFPDARFS